MLDILRGPLGLAALMVLLLAGIVLPLLPRDATLSARSLQGIARVTDGDTLRLSGQALRLKGIDAPELRQTCTRARRPYRCGEVARSALEDKIGGRSISCRVVGRDRYNRGLAFCSIDGQDLGAWLVREGHAVSYRRDYRLEEEEARSRKAGLWAGTFDRPEDWRREHGTRSVANP